MHIKVGDAKFIFNKEYTTHMGVLVKVEQMSEGPVLELGGGFFSTPLLHWLCAEKRRRIVTYEDNRFFDDFLKRFTSRTHSIVFIDNWDEFNLGEHWGMVFVDHDPVDGSDIAARRKYDTLRLKDKADYIVIHDTNFFDKDGKWDNDFWSNFKYVYHWTWATPNVSIVSNFKEIKL